MSSPKPPDLSRPIRRPSERLALVEYIAATKTLQENEHLEWKSGYDLATKIGAAKTAKQLIGFANRDPSRAQRWTGGHAYVLLGVEAGQLSGTTVWDSADIENWLAPFVGAELVYDVHYLTAQGQDVLLLEVAPPSKGDAIFSLQATTGDGKVTMTEGTIYVRRGGKTEVANAAEIRMLSSRARHSGGAELALGVEVEKVSLSALPIKLLSDEFRDGYLEKDREKLLADAPAQEGPIYLPPVNESRRIPEFKASVKSYIKDLSAAWQRFALAEYSRVNKPELVLGVDNSTEENFEDVVVEATLPLARCFVARSPEELAEQLNLPERPPRWGSGLLAGIKPKVRAAIASPPEVELVEAEGSCTKARFKPIHVYPQTRHPLAPLTVALPSKYAGEAIEIRWRATASNTRGQVSGTAEIEVPEYAEESAVKDEGSSAGAEAA